MNISIYIHARNGIVIPRIFYSDKIDIILYCLNDIEILLSEDSVVIIFIYLLMSDSRYIFVEIKKIII